jgi:hypothetical protein
MSITNNNYTIIYNSDGYNIIPNDEIKPINNINSTPNKNIIKVTKKSHTHVSELPLDKLADYLHR